jgi:hypothetical protein
MSDLLQKLDVIHAEAVRIAEHSKLMKPDALVIHERNDKHVANICKLRNMLKKALDNMATVTNDTQGDYYLEGHEGHDLEIQRLLNQNK